MAAPTAPAVVVIEPAPAGLYAGVVSRAIALGIDAAIVQGTLLAIAALLGLVASLVGGAHLDTAGQVIAAAVWLLATAGYFVAGWSLTGQTLGMRAMELAVCRHDSASPPTLARSIVRVIWLGLCIIPFFAGFLPALFDNRRRGLHDMVAGTVVVRAPSQRI
jgi:uncharacterized RDD family membrane protein YckC